MDKHKNNRKQNSKKNSKNIKKNKITISFAKEYTDLYYFLKDKKDRSNFICNLLNSNIASLDGEEKKLEEVIEKTLIEVLSRYDFSKVKNNNNFDGYSNNNNEKEEELTQEDKDLINILF